MTTPTVLMNTTSVSITAATSLAQALWSAPPPVSVKLIFPGFRAATHSSPLWHSGR